MASEELAEASSETAREVELDGGGGGVSVASMELEGPSSETVREVEVDGGGGSNEIKLREKIGKEKTKKKDKKMRPKFGFGCLRVENDKEENFDMEVVDRWKASRSCSHSPCYNGSQCNSAMLTFDGVDVMGERLAEEVPVFCGFYILEKMASHASWFLGRTGRHLFLTDKDNGKPPLLLRMAYDWEDLKFMSALQSFKHRVAYANNLTPSIELVGWSTSSLRLRHELPKHRRLSRGDQYPHVVNEETVETSNGKHEVPSEAKANGCKSIHLEVSSSSRPRFMAEGRGIPKLVEATKEGREEKKAVGIARAQIGSSPPRCERRCSACGHCEAVQVPVVPQVQLHRRIHRLSAASATPVIAYSRGDGISNYMPMCWKCKCGDFIFNP
ncbi:EPIDERMAL PATTERNING FACTOR-like protein 2 [Morella rubra]|uniref:EPIDERMAL PATTERNING FACTOR-like protein 2 n=1 Tax=Morella rubra TaxID=262757 RepID=A0A6A1UVH7_9ROSI|nr:EPIDERMAL PATTERNING FACTOR-like protein 2 [Morella rubra]